MVSDQANQEPEYEETTTLKKDTPTPGKVIEIDEALIKDNLGGAGLWLSGRHAEHVAGCRG
jgi:hypothetical protein